MGPGARTAGKRHDGIPLWVRPRRPQPRAHCRAGRRRRRGQAAGRQGTGPLSGHPARSAEAWSRAVTLGKACRSPGPGGPRQARQAWLLDPVGVSCLPSQTGVPGPTAPAAPRPHGGSSPRRRAQTVGAHGGRRDPTRREPCLPKASRRSPWKSDQCLSTRPRLTQLRPASNKP